MIKTNKYSHKPYFIKEGQYNHITIDWIKKQLVKSYHGNSSDMNRKLIINKSFSNYEKLGYVMFALNGSPPKGCAIYSPGHKHLIIISAWGKTKKFKDIIVEDLIDIN